MKKDLLLMLGAAAVGLYFLARWNNKGESLALPTGGGLGALLPSFSAPATPTQASNASSGQIIATFAPPPPAPFVPAAATWGGAVNSNTGSVGLSGTVDANGLRTYSDGSTHQMTPDEFAWFKTLASGFNPASMI